MRHPSIRPIKSSGRTITKRTPERIGQTTLINRKSSTKKMRLICLNRIWSPTRSRASSFIPLSKKSGAAGEDHRLTPPPMHFRQIFQRQNAYPPQSGLSRRRKHWLCIVDICFPPPDRRHTAQTRIWRNPRNSTYRVGLSSRSD